MKNLMYRWTDNVEKLAKALQDADIQLVDCMKQIKSMVEEKDIRQKELEELRTATQAIVDMVDTQDEGSIDNRTLLDHLCEAPQ